MADYTQTKHVIRYWRGSRSSYNFLKDNKALDPWMRYSVVDEIPIDSATTENHVEEYFGTHKITNDFGENLPVESIVEPTELSKIENPDPYSRYLVGTDTTGYQIAQYEPKKDPSSDGDPSFEWHYIKFDWKRSVRVKDDELRAYVYVDGQLITHDSTDCGSF